MTNLADSEINRYSSIEATVASIAHNAELHNTIKGYTMQKDIQVSNIRIEGDNLRTVRDTDTSFIEIRESIQDKGVLLPIVVAERTDVDGETYYLLIDGAHRFTACQQLGLETIPASIRETATGDAGKLEVLEIQIAANAQKAETKPAEYAAALLTLMHADLLMTESELAAKVNKSPQWLRKNLTLNKIKNEVIREKIDSGEVPVMNAYQLARLDEQSQADFLADAMVKPAGEFQASVNERINEVKKANREGRETTERAFVGKAIRRKDSEITAILEDDVLAESIATDAGVSVDGFVLGLNYVLSLDPQTLEARRTEWEENERMRKEKTEKAKQLKKAQRAAEKQLEVEAANDASAEALAGLTSEEIEEAQAKAKANMEAKKAAKLAKAKADAEAKAAAEANASVEG